MKGETGYADDKNSAGGGRPADYRKSDRIFKGGKALKYSTPKGRKKR